MKSILVFLIGVSTSAAFARLSDGKVQHKIVSNALHEEVSPGFHFNKDAPANLVISGGKEVAPTTKEDHSLIFPLADVGPKSFTVSFYVCDDKKTVCEEHQVPMSVKNGQVQLSAKTEAIAAAPAKKAATTAKTATPAVNSHGFIDNDLEGALSLAKKSKKLILADYGAPWCPACVRLESEVFGTREFTKLTKNVVKLYLNADDAANKEFGKKYQIKALPTLLVLNAEGEEIYRSLDFKPVDVLAKEMTPHLKKTSMDWASLEKHAAGGDKKAQRILADQAFAKLDYEAATKWYSLLGENNSFYGSAETSLWADKYEKDGAANEAKYIDVLNKWIKALPDSYLALVARVDLAKIYTENKKELPADTKAELLKNIELTHAVLASDKNLQKMWTEAAGDIAPYRKEEVLDYQISTAELLNNKEEKTKAVADLRASLEKKSLSIKRPGEVLMGLGYFRKVEWTAKEEQWLLDLDKTYPGTYAYPMKLTRFYMRAKSFDKALPYATTAVERGGGLRFTNLKTLAEVQKELKQNESARKTIDTALNLPEAKLEKNQAAIKALEEMKKAL